jgi:hypothetical protein
MPGFPYAVPGASPFYPHAPGMLAPTSVPGMPGAWPGTPWPPYGTPPGVPLQPSTPITPVATQPSPHTSPPPAVAHLSPQPKPSSDAVAAPLFPIQQEPEQAPPTASELPQLPPNTVLIYSDPSVSMVCTKDPPLYCSPWMLTVNRKRRGLR